MLGLDEQLTAVDHMVIQPMVVAGGAEGEGIAGGGRLT